MTDVPTFAPTLSRRAFIGTVAVATGGFALGLHAAADAANVPEGAGVLPLVWIDPDGAIRIVTPSAEMGQGSSTSLPLILAEELDADWSKVQVLPFETSMAIPAGVTKSDFVAANSNTTRKWFTPMRRGGATARAMLIAVAAARWKVEPARCTTTPGKVVHPDGRQSFGYGALAADAAKLTPPKDVAFKTPADYRLIGKTRNRNEVPDKVTGKAQFAPDVRLPGMVFASTRQGPVAGATLKSFDEKAALAVAGVKKLFAINKGATLVAIASNSWAAMRALDAASPVFVLNDGAGFNSVDYTQSLVTALDKPGIAFDVKGDVAAHLDHKKTVKAVYQMPFLAHATMEPMSCMAWVHDGICEIAAPTQVPFRAVDAVVAAIGLPADKVRVRQTWLGGGFGRRAETDFIVQCAEIAVVMKVPVSLIWSRAEDFAQDVYRPAYAVACEAALDKDGGIAAYRTRIAGGSIMRSRRPELLKPGAVDVTVKSGLVPELYPIAHTSADWVEVVPAVPVGFWRSVGHSQNMFALESFIDELALAAGQDPYQYRRARTHDKRAIAVLDKAAELGRWSEPTPKGHGRGIALVTAYDSFIATVVEASIEDGQIKLHHIASVMDCGLCIQPDNVRAQIEGASLFGLTAAIHSEASFRGGAAEQRGFADYRMLTIADIPEVVTMVLPSDAPPGGVGETGVPTMAPALANALFRATGTRARSLPLGKHFA